MINSQPLCITARLVQCFITHIFILVALYVIQFLEVPIFRVEYIHYSFSIVKGILWLNGFDFKSCSKVGLSERIRSIYVFTYKIKVITGQYFIIQSISNNIHIYNIILPNFLHITFLTFMFMFYPRISSSYRWFCIEWWV